MLSEEALIGMKVRVRDSLLRADLRGLEGTIARRWGSPHYLALDVLSSCIRQRYNVPQVRSPMYGTRQPTAQSRVNSMSSMRTARVSPGSAPST